MTLTVLIIVAAFALLGLGFYRALPLGKFGVLAWLQSVVLMLPWMLLFALMTFGVPVSFAVILAFLLISIGVYIGLGRWLRAMAATGVVDPQQLNPSANPGPATTTETTTEPAPPNHARADCDNSPGRF